MTRAREFALGWWEEQGRKGVWGGKEFNDRAFRLQVLNRFPEEWKEPPKAPGPLAGIDYSKLPPEAIERVLGGEHILAVLADMAHRGLLVAVEGTWEIEGEARGSEGGEGGG